MQYYKEHNTILIQSPTYSCTYERNIIKLICSVRSFSIKHIKKNIIHLNGINRTHSKSYVNPYYHWRNKQFTNHTRGMKIHTIWYD